MTIGQHISDIRNLLELHSRTEESYTDQFIYEILKGAWSEIQKNIAKSQNQISEWNYKSFTIELIDSDAPNQECVPDYLKQCKVKRSKYKIPKALKSRNSSLVRFKTLNGEQIFLNTEDIQIIYKNDKYRNQNIMASIINEYLYIWNRPNLKLIKVEGIWEDITKWADIPSCNDEEQPCFNIYDDDFGIDEDYKLQVYKLVFEMLKIPLSIIQDATNDSNAELTN